MSMKEDEEAINVSYEQALGWIHYERHELNKRLYKAIQAELETFKEKTHGRMPINSISIHFIETMQMGHNMREYVVSQVSHDIDTEVFLTFSNPEDKDADEHRG